MVSIPRHTEEGAKRRLTFSIGTADGGPKKQAGSVRPRCRGAGRPRHRACCEFVQARGAKSISEGNTAPTAL